VQRDDPDSLQQILRESHNYGYDDMSKAILIAADKGFEQCVRILLRKAQLQDIHDSNGFTPLHVAARRGK
jgi:ankyrin repeat protein